MKRRWLYEWAKKLLDDERGIALAQELILVILGITLVFLIKCLIT